LEGVLDKLVILTFLIVATTVEARAMSSSAWFERAGVGAAYRAVSDRRVLRFGYGLSLNLAPLEFGRLVGLHIATLFVVWQITSSGAFHSIPTVPILLCGRSSPPPAASGERRPSHYICCIFFLSLNPDVCV
jgi:small multidrug resistance family-3 protein